MTTERLSMTIKCLFNIKSLLLLRKSKCYFPVPVQECFVSSAPLHKQWTHIQWISFTHLTPDWTPTTKNHQTYIRSYDSRHQAYLCTPDTKSAYIQTRHCAHQTPTYLKNGQNSRAVVNANKSVERDWIFFKKKLCLTVEFSLDICLNCWHSFMQIIQI